MSKSGQTGLRWWRSVRARFELTSEERRLVWGIMLIALIGLLARAGWIPHRAPGVGVMAQEETRP